MSDEIKVTVCKYPDRANLVLRYIDPTTGRQRTKTAGTPDEATAIGKAAVWEEELRTGRYVAPSRLTWTDFRQRVADEKLGPMCRGSQEAYNAALDHFERLAGPNRVAKVTAALMTRFQTEARAEGMKETTLHKHLRHLKAVFRWGEGQGLLAKAPRIVMPKLPSGNMAKHRPVTLEEFERLLVTTPKVRKHDAAAWERLLRGLWLSGLRVSEAVALTWDGGPFVFDTTGRHPAFVIDGAFQKSRRHETAPATPDFAEWILAETPEAERVGRVFPLPGLRDGSPMAAHRASEIIGAIAERARVVVGTTERVSRDDKGRLVRTPVKMYAGAHDLRRSFCTRWAQKVKPPVLQRLARHSHITTTVGYYVALDADDIAAELWANHTPAAGDGSAQGNILGNTGQKAAKREA